MARLLSAFVVLIGILALALLLWEPHLEGRNAHASLFEIYCKDPFLAFAYLASIPFFIALYQAFRLSRHYGRSGKFPQATAKSLRIIRVCAFTLIGFVVVGELLLLLGESDDRAGGVFMGALIASGSLAVAIVAARFERVLRQAVDTTPGND